MALAQNATPKKDHATLKTSSRMLNVYLIVTSVPLFTQLGANKYMSDISFCCFGNSANLNSEFGCKNLKFCQTLTKWLE